MDNSCFNPCRVFTLAATLACPFYPLFQFSVSIPVGFSRSLQQASGRWFSLRWGSFNPCRVFTLAATEVKMAEKKAKFLGFNPCRVFTLAATSISIFSICGRSSQFQSLSGFHARCNLIRQSTTIVMMVGFNPCRVFTLAATAGSYSFSEKPNAGVSIPVGFSRSLQL